MRLRLIAVGRLKAGPERELAQRYIDRFDALARRIGLTELDVREIDEARARRPEDRRLDEARTIAAMLGHDDRLVVFDERGQNLPSMAFATFIADTRDSGTPSVALVIGGPDGIDDSLRARGALLLACGAMTWPHQLVRILAAEQIYRAATILSGHPYHRANGSR